MSSERRRPLSHGGRRWLPIPLALLVTSPVCLEAQQSTDSTALPGFPQEDDSDRVTSAAAVLGAMDPYMGHWRTERKTGPDGGSFHFEYDLAWMDAAETIAHLEITRVAADGSTSTIFLGFKGREPSGEGVYYHAASPSGRGGRGEVYLEGDRLVTAYEGWTADGSVVEIRDVFEPVEEGRFVSRTYLRSSPGESWRAIGEDRWTRTGPAR